MGRVGHSQSLRSFACAWDHGIRHFDIARHYGMGEAERVLGEFLQGRRSECLVATKFGYPTRRLSSFERAIFPALRLASGVTSRASRMLGKNSKPRPRFSAALLASSVADSLRQLRTDYLDIVYLHDASAEELSDPELASAAQKLLTSGAVRTFGLCADASTVHQVAKQPPSWLTAFQCDADPFRQNPDLPSASPQPLVFNHPFGSTQRMQRFSTALQALSKKDAIATPLREKLRDCDQPCTLDALFGVILSQAPIAALVLSMMQEAHIRENVRAVQSDRFTPAELAQIRWHLASPVPADGRATPPPTTAPPGAASAP